MDHDDKHTSWAATRAWLSDAIDAVEAQVYSCLECLDGLRFPHATCLHREDHAHELDGRDARWGFTDYHSPEAVAKRIAENPALGIPCPECYAMAGQECRRNTDGKYITCWERKSAHAHQADPGLFAPAAPVMAPPRPPSPTTKVTAPPRRSLGQGSLF